MSQPPSFEPRGRAKRPSAEGARRVGQSGDAGSPPRMGRAQRRREREPRERERHAHEPHNQEGRSQESRMQERPGDGSQQWTQRPNGPIRRSAFSTAPEDDSRGASSSSAGGPPPSYLPRSRQAAQQRQANREPAHQRPAHPAPAQHRPGFQRAPGHDTAPPPGEAPAQARKPRKKRSAGKTILAVLLVLVVATGAWVAYLYAYGNARLNKVDALSGAPETPGTTFLIVGSDQRDDVVADGTEGQRADTIMLLHTPDSGPTALVSLPRDTLITYPGSDNLGKLNGAYSYGGSEYLVEAVEGLTGLTVDNYVEIGMSGVKELTDAVGGVELCLDYDVSDELSGLEWTAGCHHADGNTALAFSRMRYSDPLGDIGRNDRQRQVVSKIIDNALSPATLLNPIAQRNLVGNTADVLTVHEGGNLFTVARAGLALRSAIGPGGLMGAPPIESLNYPGPGGSSTVLLAPEAEQFWVDLRNGDLTKESFASF